MATTADANVEPGRRSRSRTALVGAASLVLVIIAVAAIVLSQGLVEHSRPGGAVQRIDANRKIDGTVGISAHRSRSDRFWARHRQHACRRSPATPSRVGPAQRCGSTRCAEGPALHPAATRFAAGDAPAAGVTVRAMCTAPRAPEPGERLTEDERSVPSTLPGTLMRRVELARYSLPSLLPSAR